MPQTYDYWDEAPQGQGQPSPASAASQPQQQAAPQPQQQKEDSVARAIADISNAVQMSQGGAGQTGNAPAAAQTAPTASAGGLQGVPSYSDMYDAYGDSNINILQRLMQMRGGY